MSIVNTKKSEDLFCLVLMLFHASLVCLNVIFKKALIPPLTLANSEWTRNFLYFVAVPSYCMTDVLLLVSK